MCASLVDQHSDASWRHDTQTLHTHLGSPVAIPLRKSRNIEKTAIRISTAAATVSAEVVISCPSNAQAVRLEHEIYPYYKAFLAEHTEPGKFHAESE